MSGHFTYCTIYSRRPTKNELLYLESGNLLPRPCFLSTFERSLFYGRIPKYFFITHSIIFIYKKRMRHGKRCNIATTAGLVLWWLSISTSTVSAFLLPTKTRNWLSFSDEDLLIRTTSTLFMVTNGDSQQQQQQQYDNDETDTVVIKKKKRRGIKRAIKKLFYTAVPEDQRRGGMTDEEILSVVYNNMDKDRDGVLTRDELLQAGIPIATLNALDFDRTGTIKKWEFQKGLRSINGKLNTGASDRDKVMDDIDDTIGELLPLEREQLRLGGFEPYVLVSVLTAQSSFGLIGNIDVNWNAIRESSKLSDFLSDDWSEFVLLVACGITTLASIYSTVVFALTILYGKTALGMEKDEAYNYFMDNTGLQRFRAFQGFTFALFGYAITVLCQILTRLPDAYARFPFLIASIVLMYSFKSEYDTIMVAAAPMFNNKSILDIDNNNNNSSDSGNKECYLDEYNPITGDCDTKKE